MRGSHVERTDYKGEVASVALITIYIFGTYPKRDKQDQGHELVAKTNFLIDFFTVLQSLIPPDVN